MYEKQLEWTVIFCALLLVTLGTIYIGLVITELDVEEYNYNIQTESHWYKCDTLMCDGWEEHCPNVKMACAVCCEETN